MQDLVDVWVLFSDEQNTARTITTVLNGDEGPDTTVEGYQWYKIRTAISRDEAKAVISEYSGAARPKC